jgi:hypothetical protein
MRYLSAAVLSVMFVFMTSGSSKAVVYDLSAGGDFTVNGPFTDGILIETLNVQILKTPDLPYRPPPSAGWGVDVFGNGELEFFACRTNIGADCGYRYIGPFPLEFFIGPPSTGTNLDVSIDRSFYNSFGPIILDVSIDLPDGYSIAGLQPGLFPPNVPEPSTWAMMILGFCGIGAMTYRRRKSAILAA